MTPAELFARHTPFMRVVISIRIIPASVAFPATLAALSLGRVVLHLHSRRTGSLGHSRSKHCQCLFIHIKGIHLLSDYALDSLQDFDVVLGDKRDGLSGSTGSSSSTDSMDIVFGMCRHVVVDHEIDSGNIETSESGSVEIQQTMYVCEELRHDSPRGNIRRHQDLPPPTLESIQGSQSLTLTQLTV